MNTQELMTALISRVEGLRTCRVHRTAFHPRESVPSVPFRFVSSRAATPLRPTPRSLSWFLI